MNALLFLLGVFLAAGVALGVLLHADAGYVLVSAGPWILESSLLAFAVALILAVTLIFYGGRLLRAMWALPRSVRDALAARRTRLARDSFEAGLEHLLEGDWKRAEVELVRRAADHPIGELNYLFAARAAQRTGAAERRDHYLELAGRQGGQRAFAARLARAELQLQRGEHAEARAVLQQLYTGNPRHPYVLELLASAYQRGGEWEALRQLLSGAHSAAALPQERVNELLSRALVELLRQAATEARLSALKSAWESAPPALRATPAVRQAYGEGLARLGADAEAAAIAVQALRSGWDGAQVSIYGRLAGIDAVTQLATVESWLAQHSEKPELLLAAGRVCMRNQLWGKARSYLDAAVKARPTPEVFLVLSQLCAETRNPEEANRFSRRGLELAAQG